MAKLVTEALSAMLGIWAVQGLRSVPRDAVVAWRWVVAGLCLWVMGDVAWDVIAWINQSTPSISIADAPYLLGCPVFAVGIVRLSRLRSMRRDTEAGIDGAALAVAAFMAAWQFLIVPARDSSASLLVQWSVRSIRSATSACWRRWHGWPLLLGAETARCGSCSASPA